MSGRARRFVRSGLPALLAAWIAASFAKADSPTNDAPAAEAAPATNAVPLNPPPFLVPAPLTAPQPKAAVIPSPAAPNAPPPAPASPAPATPPAPPPAAGATPMANPPESMHFAVPMPAPFIDPAGKPEDLAAHLLVVYNANDPDSEPLARYYAQRRSIPDERVFALACPTSEEITRDQYDQTIRQPIENDLFRHNWIERRSLSARVGDRPLDVLAATRNDIWAIVLIRGVPLKIADNPADQDAMESMPQVQSTAAAVDSELALLPQFGLPLGGFVPNPFFDARLDGLVRAGPELATKLIMVTRLDGPSVADVRRMIDDGLAAENDRLAGAAVIDSRGFTDPKNGYTEGDVWLRKARDLLAAEGWPVLFDDRPETLAATEPLNHVAIYLGWYTPQANGPWMVPPSRFVPGAIAYHLHSFSAFTVRSAVSNWVGPLIDHGADATLGNVYEPYLALTPHLDILTKRLLDGDTFAEAAYASELGLSWMTTVVGDPLYRPFRKPLAQAIADAPPGDHRDWLRLQQIEQQLDAHPPATAAALVAAFAVPDPGAPLNERLGDLLEKVNDPAAGPAAEQAYTVALRQSSGPVDRIRVGLKLAQVMAWRHEEKRAQDVLKQLRREFPLDAPRFGLAPARPGPFTPRQAGRGYDPDAP